jgi:hypothetical protein
LFSEKEIAEEYPRDECCADENLKKSNPDLIWNAHQYGSCEWRLFAVIRHSYCLNGGMRQEKV